MRVRVVQAATIGLFALVMGVFWGTWFFLGRTWTTSPPDLAAVARPWGGSRSTAPSTAMHPDPPVPYPGGRAGSRRGP